MQDVETHLNTIQEMLECQEFVYPAWRLMGKKLDYVTYFNGALYRVISKDTGFRGHDSWYIRLSRRYLDDPPYVWKVIWTPNEHEDNKWGYEGQSIDSTLAQLYIEECLEHLPEVIIKAEAETMEGFL